MNGNSLLIEGVGLVFNDRPVLNECCLCCKVPSVKGSDTFGLFEDSFPLEIWRMCLFSAAHNTYLPSCAGYGHCDPWEAGVRIYQQSTAACDDAKQGKGLVWGPPLWPTPLGEQKPLGQLQVVLVPEMMTRTSHVMWMSALCPPAHCRGPKSALWRRGDGRCRPRREPQVKTEGNRGGGDPAWLHPLQCREPLSYWAHLWRPGGAPSSLCVLPLRVLNATVASYLISNSCLPSPRLWLLNINRSSVPVTTRSYTSIPVLKKYK